jgi:DNA polymerase I-like protein with 3'-5' exonuclease and polymerase domains
MMEADFSQLEVIGLAILSEDKQLRQDILDGKDMHCVSASWVSGKSYEHVKRMVDSGDKYYVAMRQAAKQPRFELQYGAGAPTIAKNNGWPLSKAEDYIKRYYERYPGVEEWQKMVRALVNSTARLTNETTSTGDIIKRGYFESITGRRYVFKQYESKGTRFDPKTKKRVPREPSFSPTQLKNYPVQGFATGDIVPEVLGRLRRLLTKTNLSDKVLLVNTVHDSVLFDVDKKSIEEGDILTIEGLSTFIKGAMELAPQYMEGRFGVRIDLPLKVDVKYGESWQETK